jgi:hypothetical protein
MNLFYIVNCFFNIPFGVKFNIKNNEISQKLNYNISNEKQVILNKISGFYGLIGPDTKKITGNIFELFNQNGIIQGVFFEKGNINFIKTYVKTDKILYEEKNGIIPYNYFFIIFF